MMQAGLRYIATGGSSQMLPVYWKDLLMKRAMTPFLLLVVLALVALFVRPGGTPLPAGDTLNPGDVAWMLTASALVLLMTPGLSFFYGGMVSFKNVVSTMLQSVIALGVISLRLGRRRLQPGVRRRHRRR